MKNKILTLMMVIFASIILGGCGKKTTAKITPTPPPKVVEIPVAERPIISLTPRKDGHMLFLKITSIPSYITQIEYELLYTAKDNSSEMEKGLGDTIKDISATVSRDLLLGTESCTNGCKYKYDEGITGGTLSLSFITKDGQVSTYESQFSLTSGANLNKAGELTLSTENFKVPAKGKVATSDFFILIKNYRGGYSVTSSGQNAIVGDYPQE